ncbi:hypothetical protein [Leucobacter triazinivorans]|uniref:Uncharacterized protein n=1 Tax=Leucobacter triazinivorans TaxID=1784719 RepID=A0A4P6KEU8_9MICO|nr:hypothetical protein [Leucobacter triazinivorans]QBE48743.1 hypothetical protein EVS81_07790 [Leucobacter triazinivorans]
MSAPVLAALIAAGGVLGAAVITACATLAGLLWRRMIRAEVTNHGLWAYTRDLIDHIYRGRIGPPPSPPDHIKHLYQTGD